MNDELLCEQCGSKENLVIVTTPFKSNENFWLCNDCQFIKFSELRNVKFFDALKTYCEGHENFKNNNPYLQGDLGSKLNKNCET